MYTLHTRFRTFGADLNDAQSVIINTISASELSRKIIKSALLVGKEGKQQYFASGNSANFLFLCVWVFFLWLNSPFLFLHSSFVSFPWGEEEEEEDGRKASLSSSLPPPPKNLSFFWPEAYLIRDGLLFLFFFFFFQSMGFFPPFCSFGVEKVQGGSTRAKLAVIVLWRDLLFSNLVLRCVYTRPMLLRQHPGS